MKTSFYFVLWIVIYPVLGLFRSPWLAQNSFIVALLVVWGVSWWLNRAMPETLRYERTTTSAGVMEEIYSGKIDVFRRRIVRRSIVEFVTAVYFGVTLIFVIFSLIHGGDANDWIALAIFGLFAYGAITKAFALNKASHDIMGNPTEEECARVAQTAYGLNYDAYRSGRVGLRYEDMLPSMPRYYKIFQVVSIIIALTCTVLGIIYLVLAIISIVRSHFAVAVSAGVMYFLYGSLATYFGLRDLLSGLAFFRTHRSNQ